MSNSRSEKDKMAIRTTDLVNPDKAGEHYIIRSMKRPNLYWTAYANIIGLSPFDATNKNQRWIFEPEDGQDNIVNVGRNLYVQHDSNDYLTLGKKNDQLFTLKEGSTAIAFESNYAVISSDDADAVAVGNDKSHQWTVSKYPGNP